MPCPVLVVEDDPDVREMMAMLFTMEGFEPTTAANGREALDQLLAGLHPHVIVLDLMMPKFNGVEVLKYMRSQESTRTVPVIVMSNAFASALGQQAAAAGATRMFAKNSCNEDGGQNKAGKS